MKFADLTKCAIACLALASQFAVAFPTEIYGVNTDMSLNEIKAKFEKRAGKVMWDKIPGNQGWTGSNDLFRKPHDVSYKIHLETTPSGGVWYISYELSPNPMPSQDVAQQALQEKFGRGDLESTSHDILYAEDAAGNALSGKQYSNRHFCGHALVPITQGQGPLFDSRCGKAFVGHVDRYFIIVSMADINKKFNAANKAKADANEKQKQTDKNFKLE